MIKGAGRILFLSTLLVAGIFGLRVYSDFYSKDAQIEKLQQQKAQLEQLVTRLNFERRLAKILVLDQKAVNGQLNTTLLWVEYAHDGTTLPPKQFTLIGDEAHFDALVIKFDHGFVDKDDPLKGHTIALFTRVYGAQQAPANGFPIDTPGQVPDVYKGADPQVSQFEQTLWKNFWRLYEDPDYRKEKGVRVAEGESPWGKFEPGQLYTLTVETDGGVNLTHEPVDPIYFEAMKHRPAS
jgi:hypothetical protein